MTGSQRIPNLSVVSKSLTEEGGGMTDLPKTYTLEEVADALGMSTRWVRGKLAEVEHMRAGHKIRFTQAQYEAFRDSLATKAAVAVPQSITTGRKKKSA